MRALLILFLSSCAALMPDRGPPVVPVLRGWQIQMATTVRIDVECALGEPWGSASHGEAVLVGERRLITAAHVVACPELPVIRASMWDGSSTRLVVEREDGRADLARLVVASAERYDAAPPVVGIMTEATGYVMVHGPRGAQMGHARDGRWLAVDNRTGDSGSPVYDSDGALVGIIVAGDGTYAEVVPVPADWLPRR